MTPSWSYASLGLAPGRVPPGAVLKWRRLKKEVCNLWLPARTHAASGKCFVVILLGHTSGSIEGFVDLGGLGEESSGGELADHGLAVVFQPFTGQWMQILGVFASRGNVKAAALSKVVLEATLLCEQAGLFVDGVTCDAASWNRSMWKLFGIRVTFKHNAPRAGTSEGSSSSA
ncbi:uncharacterized protein LOC144172494 [Haemaphysalis longicornis]